MKLKSLKLTNFRNYAEQKLCFNQNLNVFLGNNAQGKTNLLESIYLLALTRSHRTFKDKELIGPEQDFAKLTAEIENNKGQMMLEVELTSHGKKTKVNHLEQAKLSNYIGKLNVVLFAPEDLELIKGSPMQRRKFIDMELGQIKPLYVYHLNQYQKTLKQRNQLLKMPKPDALFLDVLDEKLAEHGSYLMQERVAFVQKLEQFASQVHSDISQTKEKLTLTYQTVLPIDDQLQANLLKLLQQNRSRDLEQRTTLKGPHRDDLLLFINDRNVQVYGSQGQQRLAALSLKLSEVELICEEIGEYPILLLDDVMSELDNERQMQLMKAIENKVQTFITTTTLKHLKAQMEVQPAIFDVKAGVAKERDENRGRKSENE